MKSGIPSFCVGALALDELGCVRNGPLKVISILYDNVNFEDSWLCAVYADKKE